MCNRLRNECPVAAANGRIWCNNDRIIATSSPMHAIAPTPVITVDITVYPGFKAVEAIGPVSVFEYANLHRQRRRQPPGYDVRVASFKTAPIRSDTLQFFYNFPATVYTPLDGVFDQSNYWNQSQSIPKSHSNI